jgi:hypothetical protein
LDGTTEVPFVSTGGSLGGVGSPPPEVVDAPIVRATMRATATTRPARARIRLTDTARPRWGEVVMAWVIGGVLSQ